MKFGRNGDPIVPARYDDPLSKSIYYNGKAYSTTPARATDEEIEDDLAQMRKTWDGKPYVKPASPQEVLPEFDDYGYKGRIVKKPKSKLESDIRNGPPTREELVHGSHAKDEEAGFSIEISGTRGEPLNTNERFWGCKFRGDEEESSITTSDTRYKTFLGEEVSQPNQAPGEEVGSSLSKPNSPRVPLMEEVVQDSEFKVRAVEILLEACNTHDEPLPMKEVVQDNQFKDKEVESWVAPDTPTALAVITCASDTGMPATTKKRKISEISEFTSDSLTSPLDGKMPQAGDEEGPPHKRLRNAEGVVNLPIPPESPAAPKKVIPAHTKKPAVRKARQGGGGRARKTARACKASSVVNKPADKAAAPAVPVTAGTPSANAKKPTEEPAVVSKGLAVVVVTRAASRSTTGKDNSPTATAPKVECSTDETTTDQEYKESTSSEGGDDLEKDGSYAPVAPRKRRVARKGKASVAPRKRAAQNKPVTSKEEKTPVQHEDKLSTAISEVDAGLEIDSTKPTTVSRSRGVKRKVTGLEDEIAVQEETRAPVTHGVDALMAGTPAPAPPRRVRRKATVPKDAIIEPLTTPTEDTALAKESGKSGNHSPRPRKRARKAANIPEDRDIVGEGVQQPARPEADAVRTTQKPARVPSRRPRRGKATAPEEAITSATGTPAEIDTALTKENTKPAQGPKRRGRNANAPAAEATAQRKDRQLASHGVDASLTVEKPAPAPLERDAKRKAMAPEEAATRPPTAPKVNTTLAEIAKPVTETRQRWRRNVGARAVEVIHQDTGLKIDNTKPSAASGSSGVKRKATQLENEVANQQEAEPSPTPVVDASPAVKKTKLAPTPKRSVKETITALQVITTAPLDVPKADAAPAQGSDKPAAGPRKRRKKKDNTPEVGATVQQEARPPAAPKVDSALIAEKPTPDPTTGSPRREIDASEELVPRAPVSETPVGGAEGAASATTTTSLAPTRRPRYRIPAEGSRKSSRIKSQHNKLK